MFYARKFDLNKKNIRVNPAGLTVIALVECVELINYVQYILRVPVALPIINAGAR